MKYIEYKYSTWSRLVLPDSVNIEHIKRMINDKLSIDEIVDILNEDNIDLTWEPLFFSDDFIFPKDNNGYPTLELHDDDTELSLICDNGTKNES